MSSPTALLAGALTAALLLAGCAAPPAPGATPARYLYVWAGDEDGAAGDSDFLAVVDVGEGSARFGEVIASVPIGLALRAGAAK